jgi:hypothetical protein
MFILLHEGLTCVLQSTIGTSLLGEAANNKKGCGGFYNIYQRRVQFELVV